MKIGRRRLQKWVSSFKTILLFIIVGLIVILALLLPSEKNSKGISVATGNDSSSMVVDYMMNSLDLKASKVDFESKTMGDC
ncbi:MAG: hypothetical protein RR515_03455 [Clostridium sp.]